MKSKLLLFLGLINISIASHAQVLVKKQIDLQGKTITVVVYSYQCFVEKGEGIKVKFFDPSGNVFQEACRTGGGNEPIYYTFPDGKVRPGIL